MFGDVYAGAVVIVAKQVCISAWRTQDFIMERFTYGRSRNL